MNLSLPIVAIIIPVHNHAEFLAEAIESECAVGAGALFRRRALELAGDWNPELPQTLDYDFWLRAGLYGDIVHIPKVLATFRVHPQSQSYRPMSEQVAEEPVRVVSALF